MPGAGELLLSRHSEKRAFQKSAKIEPSTNT
jgi:hypothetical protein